MAERSEHAFATFRRELRTIARRGRQVWRLVPVAHRCALLGAVAVMAITSAASTAVPVLIGQLVQAVNPQTHRELSRATLAGAAVFYLGLIGAVYVLRESFNVVRRYLVENSCTRIDKEMCVRVVSHLLRVDLAELGREQVGAINGRIARSIDGYVKFLRLAFLDFLPALLTGAFALVAAVAKQPRIALVMAAVVPASLALTVWQLVTQKGVRLGLLRSREAMDGTVVEQLSGIDYIRAANTHRQEVRRVAQAAERRRAKEFRHHVQMSQFGCAKALNEGAFHLFVLAYAIYLFLHGDISFGDILVFSGLFLNVMGPLAEVHRVLDEAHESSLRVGDLVDLLTVPVDRSFKPVEPRAPELAPGGLAIEARDLVMEYPTPDGRSKRALHGLSLSVRHGETIGVAGRSGCGKTTWLRTMMRLTHAQGGWAALGGVPLHSVSREAIGGLIGYVGQNPFVFAGTIAENIAYGCEGATESDIRHAAERACLHEEILAMPGGYAAVVAERGQNLSGGQRQRIALARVFLKNPPILVLDEGTSALDNISERRVQEAITEARADRTVILVAHRLTTLRDADRIFVFDEGRLVEEGPYGELVHRGGTFAELVHCAGSVHGEAAPVL
jgi:ATP-binding cassette subfamily B protein